VGILGRHIHVPSQNAARRARRPAGLPTDATSPKGDPKSLDATATTKASAFCFCFCFCIRSCFTGPRLGAASGPGKPAGRRTWMCAVFGAAGSGFRKFPACLRTRSAAKGAPPGVCFFGYFLCTSKESDARGSAQPISSDDPPRTRRPELQDPSRNQPLRLIRRKWQQTRIQHHMLDALAFPGVADVYQPIASLDDRRIREFVLGTVFQRQYAPPTHTVTR
jgi:hypothetical protein